MYFNGISIMVGYKNVLIQHFLGHSTACPLNSLYTDNIGQERQLMESSSRPSEYEEKVVSIIHLFMVYLMMLSVTQTILIYPGRVGTE
jgi:hypothetical protein